MQGPFPFVMEEFDRVIRTLENKMIDVVQREYVYNEIQRFDILEVRINNERKRTKAVTLVIQAMSEHHPVQETSMLRIFLDATEGRTFHINDVKTVLIYALSDYNGKVRTYKTKYELTIETESVDWIFGKEKSFHDVRRGGKEFVGPVALLPPAQGRDSGKGGGKSGRSSGNDHKS